MEQAGKRLPQAGSVVQDVTPTPHRARRRVHGHLPRPQRRRTTGCKVQLAVLWHRAPVHRNAHRAGATGAFIHSCESESTMIDLAGDAHVHTAFSAGRDSVSVVVATAEQAGLREVTFADQVGPDTGWLASYLASIQRAQQRTELLLRRGVEVEAIGIDGWLAFPSDLNGLDVISVGLHRLPLPAGLLSPDAARSLIDAGAMRVLDVVEQLIPVTALAVDRVSRYAPTRLARPLQFLEQAGIHEAVVTDGAIAELVAACRTNGTVVEVSE